MNDPMSHYRQHRTQMTALQVCWCGDKGKQYLFCIGYFIVIHVLVFLLLFSTFWMLRSMLSGRLKRNLKRCRTLSALRVESALSFRPKTSWKRVSAVSLAPVRRTERDREWVRGKEAGENEKLGYYKNKCWYHISLLMSVSGFLPALSAIWHSRAPSPAKEKVTAISYWDSFVEPLHS